MVLTVICIEEGGKFSLGLDDVAHLGQVDSGTSRPSRYTASCRGLIASYTLSLSNPENSITIYKSSVNVDDDCDLNPLLDDERAGLEPLVQLLYHLRFQSVKNKVFNFQRYKVFSSVVCPG